MEFKGTILFDASPSLLKAFNRLVDVYSATVVAKPALDITDMGLIKETPTINEVGKEEVLQPESVQSVPISDTDPVPVQTAKYTKEQVKAAAAAKKDKRDEMKKILDKMGVKSIPALAEEQYEEFMQKISVL